MIRRHPDAVIHEHDFGLDEQDIDNYVYATTHYEHHLDASPDIRFRPIRVNLNDPLASFTHALSRCHFKYGPLTGEIAARVYAQRFETDKLAVVEQ
jgi:hypothetical protein